MRTKNENKTVLFIFYQPYHRGGPSPQLSKDPVAAILEPVSEVDGIEFVVVYKWLQEVCHRPRANVPFRSPSRSLP